ncbi:uncharacterized protein LOC129565798 [Sitodiplosis mosellana]|uniref:uncharacterized protein LOC129565798 n=1 Tax=Sitodiplosis mosellana TaxID=263140 RepID=UPI002444CF71|nr:uncharacterized protein LOC129565798 [Sitodiplosis mosellana]
MSFSEDENSVRTGDDANDNHKVPIRTFYVSPIEEHITEDKIKKYFEDFGQVESVEIHANKSFQSCFVRFKDVASATALNMRQHRIENVEVNVRAADLSCQPDFQPLWIPLDQDSASHILIVLDDDCLREIFKHLNQIDLSSAAEVCVRFNQQAKDTFAKKYKHLDLSYDDCSYMEEIKKDSVKCLLHNFGSTIYSLDVDERRLQSGPNYQYLISMYCTQLKKLKLSHFAVSIEVKPLLKMLEQLHFSWCDNLGDVENLLVICDELKVLRIEDCYVGGTAIQRKFGKLEEFYFSNNTYENNELNRFIGLNPSLLKLSVTGNTDYSDLSETARLISQGLPKLLELEFQMFSTSHDFFQKLGKFESLRVLKFNLYSRSATLLLKHLVENETPIEHLKLSDAKIDAEGIEYISQMKLLKIIDLSLTESKFTDEHFIKWAKDLSHLQELHLTELTSFDLDTDSSIKISTIGLKKMLSHAHKLTLLKLTSVHSISIDVDDYKAMLKTVGNRPEKVKLLFEITSDGDKVNVPDETLAANREVFYIDEHVEVKSIKDYDSDDCNDSYDYYDYDFDDRYDDRYDDYDRCNSSPDSDCYDRWRTDY